MTDLFLTGASGFLGGHVVQQLDARDYNRITLLCRHEPDLPPALADAGNVSVIDASLAEVDRYAMVLNDSTVIVHLAGVTGKAKREDYHRVNAQDTGLLLGAAERAGVRGLLFTSSIAVSFRNRSGYHYAESKAAAEQRLLDSTVPVCIFRPTIILGSASPIWQRFYALASKKLVLLPGSGKVRIQPIEVSDLARLIIDCVRQNRFNNEVLEIGGADVVTLDGFLQRIHRQVDKDKAVIIHLPLICIVPLLRLVESVAPDLLPVTAGQFCSFANDGSVTANPLIEPQNGRLQTLDSILDALIHSSDHDTRHH